MGGFLSLCPRYQLYFFISFLQQSHLQTVLHGFRIIKTHQWQGTCSCPLVLESGGLGSWSWLLTVTDWREGTSVCHLQNGDNNRSHGSVVKIDWNSLCQVLELLVSAWQPTIILLLLKEIMISKHVNVIKTKKGWGRVPDEKTRQLSATDDSGLDLVPEGKKLLLLCQTTAW